MFSKNTIVAVRGGGDIASGIIHRLFNAGLKVMVLEIEKPTVIRRKVSFAEVIYEKEINVEGITASLAVNYDDAIKIIEKNQVPVLVDPNGEIINKHNFTVVVDAILAKKNLGTKKNMAPLVIGVGPGFVAGEDVHVVIESNRGHHLGKIILKGMAEENTGKPGEIQGFSEERVIRANSNGIIKVMKDIGAIVDSNETVAVIGKAQIKTKIKGVVRGMIHDGFYVIKGMKIGDVDPRGIINHCYTISDKARAIGGGVLEAICNFLSKK
ncbi:selenium-dependent molybdenum cofactor biosynthesis protein YqeB [Paramaledivibacter caminithermalis]|jgi:xanthine dehydrogenase accessory factor|uniref:Xanthine dehydrogenase accessory factor n=1 Tax=Paramaledivibacter caminithermalis (strain DSM 15212 / CIP 107654 / DViRD3) TaxID=1121301 RepID=A0A1M6K8V1_PARC5|nr:selenium-dependent molybdenum cofactor biosynthesis protein YqeB [Paramaledivibacter caminithermalis]SHJ55369.1 xanthine dehydrogenase accessory factor [Paramaledivibacter caminithermalis DSM 15212]